MQAKYCRKITKAGLTIEIEETYPTRFGDMMTRRKMKKPTPEAMRHYNGEIATRKLTRLINNNFGPNDWFMTLHYEKNKRPETYEEAIKQLGLFIRRLRKLYAENNSELKYIKRTVFGSRGAVHHHVIISQGVDTAIIARLWKEHIKAGLKARPADFTPLYSTGEYSSLAAYIVKQNEEDEYKFQEKKWIASRNLKKPITEIKYINKIKWNEPPTPLPGYFIDIDEVRAGCNPINGRPYLFYRMVKLPPGFTCYDANGKRMSGNTAVKYYRQNNKEFIKQHWFDLNPEGEVVFKKGVRQDE